MNSARYRFRTLPLSAKKSPLLMTLGHHSDNLDNADRFYAAGTHSMGSVYAVGWPSADEDSYAVDELSAAASSDQAASPDGYGYVETNEYFECEDGVREMAH
jgi:hypothetical protein